MKVIGVIGAGSEEDDGKNHSTEKVLPLAGSRNSGLEARLRQQDQRHWDELAYNSLEDTSKNSVDMFQMRSMGEMSENWHCSKATATLRALGNILNCLDVV